MKPGIMQNYWQKETACECSLSLTFDSHPVLACQSPRELGFCVSLHACGLRRHGFLVSQPALGPDLAVPLGYDGGLGSSGKGSGRTPEAAGGRGLRAGGTQGSGTEQGWVSEGGRPSTVVQGAWRQGACSGGHRP